MSAGMQWVREHLGPLTRSVIERDAGLIARQAGTDPPGLAIESAQGCWLVDADGRRYLDLHGNNCHHLGHRHPVVLAAALDQATRLTFTPRGLTSAAVCDAAEAISRHWPGGPARVMLVPGGSEAVELAMMLARVNTGRHQIVSFHDSYHGRSFGALSVGGRPADRSPRLGPLLPGCLHVPPFYPLPADRRGPADQDAAADLSLAALRHVFDAERDIAAVLGEPIRNGPFVPPDWYWPQVRELCDRHGALLISDEIPTGLGKTGRLFNTEHFGIRPDITLLGKSLGGALVPVAAVICHERLDAAADLNLGYYTHERNPFCARIAATVVEVIEQEALVGQVQARAAALRATVEQALERAGHGTTTLRAAGFMLGFDVGDPSESERHREARALRLSRHALERGLLLNHSRGGAITLSAPLVIQQAEIEHAAAALQQALEATAREA
jgi:4-aminobutyrate aminotransferase